jgi:hypothetical protein
MAETPKRVLPTALGTSTASILTAPSSGTGWLIVRSVIVANIHTSAVTVNVGVATSNTDTDTTRFASAVSVGVGETVELVAPGMLVLQGHASTPDILHALCSVANKATITVSYVEGP